MRAPGLSGESWGSWPGPVRTARGGRRRSLLTSRYPPWCWRHALRPGPRRKGPGAAGQRLGGSPSASPRVGRDGITQAPGGAARNADPRVRGDPGAKAEKGRAEKTAKPREGRAFLSPTSSRTAKSYCACVALAAARSR